ncbi:Fungal specific transcription factor domain-containing protein [Cladophialophora immunda]|nr:Fungal specific transcription factor domain-containing protein [Cladophialophora immunda]
MFLRPIFKRWLLTEDEDIFENGVRLKIRDRIRTASVIPAHTNASIGQVNAALPALPHQQSHGPLASSGHALRPVLAAGSSPRSNRVASPFLSDNDSPDMLYAQVAERSVNASNEPLPDVADSVFLGETFSLTYVVHDVLAPFLSKDPLHQRCLHVPIHDTSKSYQEGPPVRNIRSLFHMSFWWGRPNDLKDSWYWLGTAISIAKSLGLHRTTASSNFKPEKTRLWKRLWWSLQIRDVLVSASLGRPRHIWQGDCDIEEPGPADVREQCDQCDPDAASYFIQLAKLSTLISRIVDARYGWAQSAAAIDRRTSLEDAMLRFQEQIPTELVYRGVDSSSGRGLWASMLLMTYNYAMILLSQPPRGLAGQEQTWEWGNAQKAFAAAGAITRAIEDLLSASLVRLCQVHTVTALFSALAVHMYAICTSQAVNHDLAEMRAKVCMLGLASMQEAWPVGGWVLKLFDRIMQRLKAKTPYDKESRGGHEQSWPEPNNKDTAEGQLLYVPPQGPDIEAFPQGQNELADRFERITEYVAQDVSSLDQGDRGDNSETAQVASAADVPSQSTVETDLDFPASLFAFDDTMGNQVFDQGKFFQWLDLPPLQDVGPHVWPA